MFDASAALVLLLEPLVDDRAFADRNALRRIEGIKETTAPEGPFIFIKGVLCRCAGESIRCDGFVVEITRD